MATPQVLDLPVPPKDLVAYIAGHPNVPMVEIMEPYRVWESELRKVFAQDRGNHLLEDPHLNLVPVFTQHTGLITTRARNLDSESEREKERYIMPLSPEKRRPNGSPAVVGSLKEFQKNFNVFSESSLVDMNWDNVVAAGSSVVNCLLPVPPEFNTTKRKLREYYHEKFCPASDVDLFLYGLTHDEAIEKIKEIERAIRDALLNEVTVVRTKYAITIASQYPVRHVQIVLRVYKSIGEILTGFDIDAAGGAYDGKQVWITPRNLSSVITQINHIDLSRRSPSYENRLSKYSHRNFEVYWADLDRSRVDPTIFERSFQRTLGLARLLVLERLPTSSAREIYMNKRREERGRPTVNRNFYRQLGGNIKDSHEDEVADWVDESEVSNYHTFSVPYGPKFHSKKIERLCFTKDLLLNAEWNQPEHREVYLHRHPAFFGRVEHVIEDCCGSCPKPVTPEEVAVAEKEAEIYISGKVSFLIDNPGRQQIGSFNPLTDDDWTDMAYIGNTARLCHSIVDCDMDEVLDWLSAAGADPNKRDYTGRSPLHLAVISSTPEIVSCLVDHGARITARLADGRTALHLAAERGEAEMVRILMNKSTENVDREEEQQARARAAKLGANIDGVRATTEDVKDDEDSDADADSEGELVEDDETDGVSMKDEEEKTGEDAILDESTEDPDFYNIDLLAWDVPCSPMHLAIAAGHEEVVTVLCEYGSDILLPVKFLNADKEPTNAILTLVLALELPLDKAKQMAKLLLKLGASSSQADLHGCTAFHRYVKRNETEMVDLLWDLDKIGVKAALNHLLVEGNSWNPVAMAPLHTAIKNGDSLLVLRLLSAGANAQIEFDEWLKAARFNKGLENRLSSYEENKKLYHRSIEQPLMLALRMCPDPDVAFRLLEAGADPNVMTQISYQLLTDIWQRNYQKGETALDVVRRQLIDLRKYTGETFGQQKPALPESMDEYLAKFEEGSYKHWMIQEDIKQHRVSYEQAEKNYQKELKAYREMKGVNEKQEAVREAIEELEKLEKLIIEKGGKTFADLHPDILGPSQDNSHRQRQSTVQVSAKDTLYSYNFVIFQTKDVTEIREKGYLELFEAAWAGDLSTIRRLTTQPWGKDSSEPPLKIAVQDNRHNNPFSVAFLRGHHDVAYAILQIAQAQYVPEEKEAKRYTMETSDDRNEDSGIEEEYDDEEEEDRGSDEQPRIVGKKVTDKFTIENIGEVSMQVKSRTDPLTFMLWYAPTFTVENDKVTLLEEKGLLSFVTLRNDQNGLKMLLDWAGHYSALKIDATDEQASGSFTYPDDDFLWAIRNGKTQMLAEIIKRTGAGIPLDHLVKKSKVEVKEKPRYYQGLTVYGKKRKDWANAGRNLVVKSTGTRTPPLLHAALGGSIESVEWFLGDAPHRYYVEFGKSKAAETDARLRNLNKAAGGFDRAVSRWLGLQNELVLHCAVMSKSSAETKKLVQYLVKACPATLEIRNSAGDTPLMTAAWLGRTSFVKILVSAGADQSVRNKSGQNLLHYALAGNPRAAQLRSFLELVDAELLPHLFKTRSNLADDGITPLHAFVDAALSPTTWHYSQKHSYRKEKHWQEVLSLLLEYSHGAELEMLNGAGQSPLHTAIMGASAAMVEALLNFRPKLLYRENTVGRTPAEVARDRVTAANFAPPRVIGTFNENGRAVGGLAERPVTFFAEKGATFAERAAKQRKEATEQHQESATEAVWRVCRTVMEKNPDTRRLVSLNEANDVAKRLGEKYSASRYFSIQARDPDDDDGDEEEKEATSGLDDFTVVERNKKWQEQWVCEDCNRRH